MELLVELLMLISATLGGSLACRQIRRAHHSGGVLADGLVHFGGLSGRNQGGQVLSDRRVDWVISLQLECLWCVTSKP